MTNLHPIAVTALDVAPRRLSSSYPEPFASLMQGRVKRQLGEVFGLTKFGVNLTRLEPGAISSIRHTHSEQDEFIYVLSGQPVLVTDQGEVTLEPGMCAGFKAGNGESHQLANRTGEPVLYLEVGDRTSGDHVHYPQDDLQAVRDSQGWKFLHKDGRPY